MKAKQKVLNYLLQNRNSLCSGQQIADELNVSRNAVWTSIEALIADGLQIEKKKNKGYIFTDLISIETEEAIKNYLNKDISLVLLEEIDSTNLYAKKLLHNNSNKQLIVAKKQTNGRGRHSKIFESPKYNGIYMSYIPAINLDLKFLPLLTIISANAVHAIAHKNDISLAIKYLNDLYYEDKKVCGILSEGEVSAEQNLLHNIVIGIGINLYDMNKISKNLHDKVTTLPGTDKLNKSKFIAQIINLIDEKLQKLNLEEEISYYNEHNLLIGKHITLQEDNTIYQGKVLKIDTNLELVVQLDQDNLQNFNSNRVSILKWS